MSRGFVFRAPALPLQPPRASSACLLVRQLNKRVLRIGGAVLAGSYFGDRCSYVYQPSLFRNTDTNLSKNINRMLRTSVVPLLLHVLSTAGLLHGKHGRLSRYYFDLPEPFL